MHKADNPQIKMTALLQKAAGRPKRKRKLTWHALLELVDNSKFMILLNYTSWHDYVLKLCCMLSIFAVKSAVRSCSVLLFFALVSFLLF